MDKFLALINNFLGLFIESAPWLILGLIIAGLMKWWLPFSLLEKQLGRANILSVLKAALIGAPLPLCSCGVIPAALGLRRSGASKSATVSFLVATPETGVDSVSVSYALLGPFMAIARPIAAITSAIYAGLLVLLMEKRENTPAKDALSANANACCQSSGANQYQSMPFALRVRESLAFASGKLLHDITGWLIIGLVIAAGIKTWIAEDFLTQWGDGFLAMVVMAVIGIPMYICATASTPIAAGFLAAGVSPGAILVFMLAGPATNLSTMGMIRKELGAKILVAYLVAIFSSSIAFGYLLNWLVSFWSINITSVAAASHVMSSSIIHQTSAILLAFFMMLNLYQRDWPKWRNKFTVS